MVVTACQPEEIFPPPQKWEWTKAKYKVRKLAKEFAEGTDSDF